MPPRRTFKVFTSRLILVIALSLVIFVILTEWNRGERAKSLRRVYGGERSLSDVARPHSVVAARLGKLPKGVDWRIAKAADYPVVGSPVEVPAAIAAEVSKVLTSTDPHGVQEARGCTPRFGVRMTFRGAENRVDVLLCFECNLIAVNLNGSFVGGEAFDYIRPVLVRAVKSLFPDDDAIQALRE